ncbi:hypothetical protein JCM10207_005274 [Rhodosporidiobolus poonsookiae]
MRSALPALLSASAAVATVGGAVLPRAAAASNSSVTNSTTFGTYPSETAEFLRALPKIEHHIHIEGALTPEFLFKLARRNNVTLDAGNFSSPDAVRERYRHWSGLEDFVEVSEQEMVVFLTEDDYADLAYDYLERSSYDGLVYAEVNFLPEGHTARNISLDTVIGGLKKGLQRGKEDFGIDTQLFACFSKSHNHTATLETIDALATFAQSGALIGLGAAGVEDGFPPSEFKEIYNYAASVGFDPTHFTIHAGETGPADYVRQAAFDLGLPRIDHAIAAARDDPALTRKLAQAGKTVTVCPLSNVALGVYDRVEDAPLRELLDAGVMFSLNTDDPTFFGGFILQVYLEVQKAFNFDKATWQRIAMQSIDMSWTSDEYKAELRGKLDAVMQQWEGKELD